MWPLGHWYKDASCPMAGKGKSGGNSKNKGKGKRHRNTTKGFLCSMLLGFVMLSLGGCKEEIRCSST